MSYEDFTKRLKAEREKHQITQNEMSKIAKMNPSHYCKGEKGYNRFSFYELQNMCYSKIDMYHCFTGKENTCIEKHDTLFQKAEIRQLNCCLQVIYLCAGVNCKQGGFGEAWKKIYDALAYMKYVEGEECNIFKRVRNYNGLTQIKMAEMLGMDVKKLRALESDKLFADSEIIYNMYDKFSISPSAFLKDEKCVRDEIHSLICSDSGEIGNRVLLLIEAILHFINDDSLLVGK